MPITRLSRRAAQAAATSELASEAAQRLSRTAITRFRRLTPAEMLAAIRRERFIPYHTEPDGLEFRDMRIQPQDVDIVASYTSDN